MLRLRSCCKRLQLLLPSCRIVSDSDTHLLFFQKESIFIIRRSYSSSKSLSLAENDKLEEKGRSFTVSYLINSCGLTPEIALSASKRVHFDAWKGPDSVINLFKHHGLNDTHISQLVGKRPELLLAHAKKTLLPKLEFFGSVGISGTGLARVLCRNPEILTRSLERSIIPCYDIIKRVLVQNDKIALFLRSSPWVLSAKVLGNIAPNISVLRTLPVPEASISSWVAHFPLPVLFETEKFKENVEKVMSMGFRPSSGAFLKALYVMCRMDASEWAQKMERYKNCGWTEDDFLLAFRGAPLFMTNSEKHFSSTMDFLVNKMGWEPAYVAANSVVLTRSLEKSIIPRCSVIRVLMLKGLIVKGQYSISTILKQSQEYFLNRFVIKYQEQAPELLSIFQGKMGLGELGLGFEECGGEKQS